MAGLELILPSDPITAIPPLFYEPAASGATGVFFLGQTGQLSRRNRIEGEPDAVMFGAPVFSTNHASIDGQVSYFDTTVPDPDSLTFLAVVKLIDLATGTANSSYFMGTTGGDAGKGANLLHGAGSLRMEALYTDGASASQLLGASIGLGTYDDGAWTCLIGTADVNGVSVYDMTTDRSLTTAVPVGYTRRPNTQSVTLGSRPTSAAGGQFEMACAMRWDRVLTDDERDEQYTVLKALYEELGITI